MYHFCESFAIQHSVIIYDVCVCVYAQAHWWFSYKASRCCIKCNIFKIKFTLHKKKTAYKVDSSTCIIFWRMHVLHKNILLKLFILMLLRFSYLLTNLFSNLNLLYLPRVCGQIFDSILLSRSIWIRCLSLCRYNLA